MKLTKKHLKEIIQEIVRLNSDGEEEQIGPPQSIDAVYHDSTRDDNFKGYTKMNSRIKVKIFKQKGDEIETYEVD